MVQKGLVNIFILIQEILVPLAASLLITEFYLMYLIFIIFRTV